MLHVWPMFFTASASDWRPPPAAPVARSVYAVEPRCAVDTIASAASAAPYATDAQVFPNVDGQLEVHVAFQPGTEMLEELGYTIADRLPCKRVVPAEGLGDAGPRVHTQMAHGDARLFVVPLDQARATHDRLHRTVRDLASATWVRTHSDVVVEVDAKKLHASGIDLRRGWTLRAHTAADLAGATIDGVPLTDFANIVEEPADTVSLDGREAVLLHLIPFRGAPHLEEDLGALNLEALPLAPTIDLTGQTASRTKAVRKIERALGGAHVTHVTPERTRLWYTSTTSFEPELTGVRARFSGPVLQVELVGPLGSTREDFGDVATALHALDGVGRVHEPYRSRAVPHFDDLGTLTDSAVSTGLRFFRRPSLRWSVGTHELFPHQAPRVEPRWKGVTKLEGVPVWDGEKLVSLGSRAVGQTKQDPLNRHLLGRTVWTYRIELETPERPDLSAIPLPDGWELRYGREMYDPDVLWLDPRE